MMNPAGRRSDAGVETFAAFPAMAIKPGRRTDDIRLKLG
jgi:hypothetical protein